ncbi:uncharacterized protein TNCV_726691 [Trichonephila clavipes]|nr:uncharacterized protein TNCV_726691 [Trichonephila clavipes]
MTTLRYVHDILQPHMLPLMQRLAGAIFNKTILGITRQGCHKTVCALLFPSLGLLDPQICLQLRSFGTASSASHEFERTRGNVTANMEQNVSRHHAEFACIIARSYRIVHSC